MNRAAFLDRDGTINEDVGDLWTRENLVFIPGALDAMKKLAVHFDLFIVTNQSGIGKKIFSEEEYQRFNDYYIGLLSAEGVRIREVYHCPHRKEDACACHKPNPYFLEQAAQAYGVDLKRSYVIGDHPHDIEMGQAVGAGAVYVLTGHGRKHRRELSVIPDCIADDLYQAAVWIQGDQRGNASREQHR